MLTEPVIYTEVVSMTPAMAQHHLDNRLPNRNIADNSVAVLLKAILRGDWHLNGETIKFTPGGRMLDGQHRLTALVSSGLTLPMLVAYNVSENGFGTIDIGNKRSLANVFTAKGEQNCKLQASAIQVVYRYENGTLDRSRDHRRALSHAEGYQLLCDRYGDFLRESCKIIHGIKASGIMQESVAAALHYLFTRVSSQAAATDFFMQIVRADGLIAGSARHVLHRALVSSQRTKKTRQQEYIAALIIKAWNAERTGAPLLMLRYQRTGNHAEPFPVIR